MSSSIQKALSEVTIECDDPSVAVGPKGSVIQALRDDIGWLVNVARAPAFESRTQHDIRRYRREMADERRALLRKFGTRIYRPKRRGPSWARLTALGSYREVGRAMHLVTTNESRVLVDVGAKPTTNKNEIQPFFTAPELLPLDNIDAVVITHAHVDHIAMLPVLFRYGYRGTRLLHPAHKGFDDAIADRLHQSRQGRGSGTAIQQSRHTGVHQACR